MILLKREPTNVKDCSAVAVMNETEVVGHVSYNIIIYVSTMRL